MNGVKFTLSSTLECLDCNKVVQVGTVGYKNLETHRGSKACRQACCERNKPAKSKKPPKPNQVLDVFFKLWAPLNPSTVSAPPPIRPAKAFTVVPEHRTLDCMEPLAHAKPACRVTVSSLESLLVLLKETPAKPLTGPGTHQFPAENQTSAKACQ